MNKPRLIDANALLEAMSDKYNQIKDKTDCCGVAFWHIDKLIKEQPTAYDIDEVVEQLLSPSCIGVEYTHGMSKDEIAESVLEQSVNRAIEIIKGGGKHDD